MNVTIREFTEADIQNKIRWINDSRNNRYLHYELPLEYKKTKAWFDKTKTAVNRFDAVIEVDELPVGLIGLLSIDQIHMKAEYYVCLGELSCRGQGIATKASVILLNKAFNELHLNRIYLFTEEDNLLAQKAFKKIGFQVEGLLKEDVFKEGVFVNRYVMALTAVDYRRLWCKKYDDINSIN